MIKQFFLLSISILLISGFSNLYADGHGGDATKGKKIFKNVAHVIMRQQEQNIKLAQIFMESMVQKLQPLKVINIHLGFQVPGLNGMMKI